MKTLKIMLFALGFLLLNASSCRKEEEETLPPRTQTGANTFGCLVNGKVWINKGMAPFPGSNLMADVLPTYFLLNATRSDNSQGINITIKTHLGVGSYTLENESLKAKYGYENCGYQTDSIMSGKLEITHYDTINYVISGRFNFKGSKLSSSTGNCDSIVNVTEGRFDIKYAN